jgi:CRP-like cAMP-binding protein
MTKAIWGLDQFDLFSGLNPNEIQNLSQIVVKKTFRTGDIITDQASKSRDVYILVKGRIDIVSLNGVQLYRVTQGEAFGELALITKLKRTAVAVAREDCIVLVLNINLLETFGEEYPDIYQKVTDNIIDSLGIKLARANKMIELLKTELAKTMRKQT